MLIYDGHGGSYCANYLSTNLHKNIIKDSAFPKDPVQAIKNGQIEIKNDKDGNVAASIGKKSFSDIKLKENYDAFMKTLLKEKPTKIKGNFVLSAYLTSTMGISYRLKLKG